MKKFRHAGIVVRDIDKSLHFYKDLLRLRVRKDLDESGDYLDKILKLKGVKVRTIKLAPERGEGLIELLFFGSRGGGSRKIKADSIGLTHVAFEVEDLDKEYLRLKKNGVRFNAPPQYSPDGYAKVTFCKDPDGVLIELVEILKK